MLIFLLLCAVLRSLQGAPLTPSPYLDTDDILSFVGRDDTPTPGDNGQSLRSRFSIVQTCLLTIFACVWTAIHPNINGETDSGWTRLKRKLTTTLMALIAPELILRWALEQRMSAKTIMNNYNQEFAPSGGEGDPRNMWTRVQGYFIRLPNSVMHRGNGQRWTMSHAFFIQMGGFLLCDKGYPTEVLDYNRLAELLRTRAIDQPTVTERELQDRSKGDVISKGVVVWQTTWFALQCCARLVQRLPLSELEVVTLAFTVVNIAIYAAWWDKPQSVDTAIRLQLKRVETGSGGGPLAATSAKDTDLDSENNANHQSVELAGLPTDISKCAEKLDPNDTSTSEAHPSVMNVGQSIVTNEQPLLYKDKPTDKESWLRRELRERRQEISLPSFLLIVAPTYLFASLLRPASKMGDSDEFDGKRLRVPMFYAAGNSSTTANYSLAVIGLVFGAIHFIAWGSEFPWRPDQVLWHCAAIALVGFPSFGFLMLIIDKADLCFESKVVKKVLDVLKDLMFYCLCLPSMILYIPARLVVIILALKAIRDPSPAILQDVSWTSFIPHL